MQSETLSLTRSLTNEGAGIPRPAVPPRPGDDGQDDHRHAADGRPAAEVDPGGLRGREEVARRGDRQVPRRHEGYTGMVQTRLRDTLRCHP